MPRYTNPSFLSSGLAWLQAQREEQTTHEISIGPVLATAAKLRATVSHAEAESVGNTGTLHQQFFHFIVRRCDLEKFNIRIQRGLRIWYLDDVYEAAYKGKALYEYNDPDRNDIIIYAILVDDDDNVSVSPG
jgi:hypothetical protein